MNQLGPTDACVVVATMRPFHALAGLASKNYKCSLVAHDGDVRSHDPDLKHQHPNLLTSSDTTIRVDAICNTARIRADLYRCFLMCFCHDNISRSGSRHAFTCENTNTLRLDLYHPGTMSCSITINVRCANTTNKTHGCTRLKAAQARRGKPLSSKVLQQENRMCVDRWKERTSQGEQNGHQHNSNLS